MNIYTLILVIIIILMLLMYINTYKKLKTVQDENNKIKQDINDQINKNNGGIDKNNEILEKIYLSDRKIALYSGILSEKLGQYKEKEYSDIIKKESEKINENLNQFKE